MTSFEKNTKEGHMTKTASQPWIHACDAAACCLTAAGLYSLPTSASSLEMAAEAANF